LPRVALLDGPTPLQPMRRLAAALGGRVDLWIKREDLGPIAFSGNKLRNLEFLLGAAVDEGATAVVTSGRRWSNHCRLTAAAGARLGLDVHVVLSGPPLPHSPNRDLIGLFGGTVHETTTDDRADREAMVEEVASRLRAEGRQVRVIPVGGSDPVGAWGQVLAGRELLEQASALGFAPDEIVVPTATGGTQAGLIVGTRAVRDTASPWVLGFVVARPEAELRPMIERLLGELAAMAGVSTSTSDIELDSSQLGPGYGQPTGASQKAAELLARTEGMLVDPVYTAKALAGLVARVGSGELDGRSVVFWHGGGLPSLFEDLGREPPRAMTTRTSARGQAPHDLRGFGDLGGLAARREAAVEIEEVGALDDEQGADRNA